MADSARGRLAAPSLDERFTFLDAPDRRVGDKPRARIAQRFARVVFGHLDDALAERLRFGAETDNRPPAIRVFGTVLLSTTLIHGVHFIEPKYCAAARISSSVIALAIAIIALTLAFFGSALLRTPLR